MLAACVLAAAGLPVASMAWDATRAGTDTATRTDSARFRVREGSATRGMRRCMDILRTGGDMRQPRTALFRGESMWTLTPKTLPGRFQWNNVFITSAI